MAQRGMLPKFRPANAGGGPARPTIRPVRPGPMGPPPAPPRKIQSGSRRADEREIVTNVEPDVDPPTAAGYVEPLTSAYAEPPTRANDYQKRQNNFEDETQARPEPVEQDAFTARRGPVAVAQPAYDESPESYERQGGFEEYAPDSYIPQPPPAGELAVPYDSLPSLAINRPFDEYEREFVDRDPAAQMRAARESAHMQRAQRIQMPEPEPTRREREGGSYDGPSHRPNGVYDRYEESYQDDYREPPPPARNPRQQVGSGARERPITLDEREVSGPQDRGAWNGMRTAGYEQPMLPAPPRMPDDAPPGFVMGVQPIRQLEGPMFPPALAPMNPMTPMTPMTAPMPAQHAQPLYTPPGVQAQMAMRPMTPPQGAMALQRGPATGPVMPAAAYVQSAQKAIVQNAPTSQTTTAAGSKTGRFAWFVFGSAFGIAFAFFATGFAPKLAGHNDAPPPPPPAMTTTAQPQQMPTQPMPTMMAPQGVPVQPGTTLLPPGMQQNTAPMQNTLPPGYAIPPSTQMQPPMGQPSLLPSQSAPPPGAGATVNGQFVPSAPSTNDRAVAPSRPANQPITTRPSRPSRPPPSRPSRPARGGGDDDGVPASRDDKPAPSSGGGAGDILGDALK